MGRRGALLGDRAHLPEHRRRHLPASRPARDPRGGRGGHQHHLQDPLQRCRGDDRRPAGRGRPRRRAQIVDQLLAEGVGAGRVSSATIRTNGAGKLPRRRARSTIATSWTRCSASCARSRASPPSSTSRPAPPRSAAAASAAPSPIPTAASFINPRVCEGCGDCSVQSNCIVDRAAARPSSAASAQINQSTCNKDFSCVKGFCPSFVDDRRRGAAQARRRPREGARGGAVRQPAAAGAVRARTARYNVCVAGIGGTGVLTVGALLGMAAHLDGLSATVLDFTGLAQKNGAVVSQVRIAPAGQRDPRGRGIGAGETDLLLGTDSLVAGEPRCAAQVRRAGRGAIVLNGDEDADRRCRQPTATSTLPTDAHRRDALGRARRSRLPARARRASPTAAVRRQHRRQRADGRLCVAEGAAAAFARRVRGGDRG